MTAEPALLTEGSKGLVSYWGLFPLLTTIIRKNTRHFLFQCHSSGIRSAVTEVHLFVKINQEQLMNADAKKYKNTTLGNRPLSCHSKRSSLLFRDSSMIWRQSPWYHVSSDIMLPVLMMVTQNTSQTSSYLPRISSISRITSASSSSSGQFPGLWMWEDSSIQAFVSLHLLNYWTYLSVGKKQCENICRSMQERKKFKSELLTSPTVASTFRAGMHRRHHFASCWWSGDESGPETLSYPKEWSEKCVALTFLLRCFCNSD